MSKKDLLERLTRVPSDPLRPQRGDEEIPGRPSEAVQTRIGTRVVRRRRVEADEPPPPVAAPVIRRRAAIVADEPATRAPVAEPALPPEPVVAHEPEPVHEPEPSYEPEPVYEPEPEPVRAPEPVREPEPVAHAEPTPEPVYEPEPIAAAPAVEPVAHAEPAPAPERTPLPEQPRYAGLGKAVVMPPPGYDPTNPAAFRRRQEAERAATQDVRRGPRRRVESQTPAPAAPAGPGPGGGDFRNTPGTPAGRRRRGSTAAPNRMFERPVRSKRRKAGPKQSSPAPKAQKRKIKVDNVISVGQLAHELGIKAPMVIRQLMELGMMASITQMLDIDTASLVAAEFDYEVENIGFQEQNYLESVEAAVEEENLQSRPPVVTIMGHVDHGKTTLLDTIRKSRVAAGEAGGITQHIGAYQVATDRGVITFIDTPGHAAFSAMRARGADVTDVVVLVVAADDGVQPQTLEAIAHAKAADVPIVVAVNKMDKPGVNPDAIMTRLAEHGLVPEKWGGETMYVPVSALKAEGIDELLESILLQAEVLDLHANPDRFAEGIVLEAKMERGRGAVATILIQRGTLKRGDHVVLGSAYGKVRAILDHKGDNLVEAGPSTPVELFGLSELPEVGDAVNSVKSEKNARALAEHRATSKKQEAMAAFRRKTADDLYAQANAEDRVVFHMVLKADVGGTLQALKAAIEKIEVEGAEARILLAGVGDMTESDVNLAAVNGAHLIGFNVKLDAKARQAASNLGVEPEMYTVIYDVLDRVEKGLKGMLAPVFEQVRQGAAEVRQLFRISKVGVVAGSYVLDGKIGRNHTVKVLREGGVIWEGKVQALKRFKDDVREVSAGYECGVSLDGFDALQEGDLLESYAEQVVAQA